MDYSNLIFLSLAAILAAVGLLWLLSIRLRDISIIDMFFAIILALVALLGGLLGSGTPERKVLVTGMVLVWAVRISHHLIRRNWGKGEDPRYTALRRWALPGWPFHWLALKQVFLLQGAVLWLVSLPVLWAQTFQQPQHLGIAAGLGAAIYLIGLFFETVGDIQLDRFRRDPANRGGILDTGLWRYTRHPNYFGEICIWWGVFLVACENPLGLLTIIGPATYTYLVINVTGKKTLEKRMGQRPGYKDYVARTSGFFPWPPKNRSR